ncbi:CNNM domain-containing protein [Planctomicrobium piriforme]|uniref:Hemolysin, contains CBS domains n=1 Tax=Planctomicrobium piriforme TaxID=1576369 RepID=A0A1I3RW33_9PLAN|nr:CNNM domain-containing protein [Planctomicrobium piriforme]SFJ50092.1 Hemolysin, contains CBS domains [Planctomicrobium piriforme]
MNATSLGYLLLAVALIALNGFFVLAEFALVKVRATRIEELARQKHRRAIRARQLVLHLDQSLAATQLGITLASLGLGWVGEPAFASLLTPLLGRMEAWSPALRHTLALGLAFAIITFLHILLGELAPKSLAIRRPEQCALAIAYPLQWATWLFYGPMKLLNGASDLVLRLVGLGNASPEIAHTEHELRSLLTTAETTREFPLDRVLMLENIFDLGQQTVRDAMIPWSEVSCLRQILSYREVLEQIAARHFSRWPVLEQDGVPRSYLLAKDLLLPGTVNDWGAACRPLAAVSPEDHLEVTLRRLQKAGGNLAVVVEHGRPQGLITLEDILEEIVGRIEDEYPRLPKSTLRDVVQAGGIVLDMEAESPGMAIDEMSSVLFLDDPTLLTQLRKQLLPLGEQPLRRLGPETAIRLVRVAGVQRPRIVFGRLIAGLAIDDVPDEPVRLLFLVVTPLERPHIQVALLQQLEAVIDSDFLRERLLRASTSAAVLEIFNSADAAATG